MAKPYITVLIPTRERCETLSATLKTCAEQDYDQLEVLVSDNCSADQTREIVYAAQDSRIRYLNPGRRLSMAGNFEFALSLARPGFVISIGDDDGLMPGAVTTAADIITQSKIRAVTSSSVYYTWPNFPTESQRNTLLIRDTRTGIELKDAKNEMSRRIRCRSGAHLYIWGLPSVYRGFVSTEVIAAAKKNGRYFHSITPDAYSAFVNSLFLDDYLYSRHPFTVEGVSGRSNGASQLVGKDGTEETNYLKENDIAFHQDLVYTPAAPIIMAEAFLQVRAQFPELSKAYDFDLESLCQAALHEAQGQPNEIRVHEAIFQIATRNSIKVHPISLHRRMRSSCERFWGAMRMHQVNCAKQNVHDVHAAAKLADSMLKSPRPSFGTKGAALVVHKIVQKISGA